MNGLPRVNALLHVQNAAGSWVPVSEGETLTEVTATADGTGTGQIDEGVTFATVSSSNANHIVTLPEPRPSVVVALWVGATGYELRTTDPENVAINEGSGVDAESAIPANTLTVCVCPAETMWLCTCQAADGAVVTTESAA
jgi:hypothetical protein